MTKIRATFVALALTVAPGLALAADAGSDNTAKPTTEAVSPKHKVVKHSTTKHHKTHAHTAKATNTVAKPADQSAK
jgi:hypothetical protein